MRNLNTDELRQLFLDFFKSKGHAIIKSASLIPENDPTVLFTTAGMHPLVPYLLGAPHPEGVRLVDVQKCVRTGDIDDVGDSSHCTFFEMLGNWSLGDYFKKDAIAWSFEFLTSEDWLAIPADKLYFTCFEGDSDAPRDMDSYNCWRAQGVPEDHIFFLPKKNNWWGPAGLTGPCGPDSEMFYDTGKPKCNPECSPACDCGKFLEIWNDVFMEFNKKEDGTFEPLAQQNVDTGMGLDRTVCTLQGKESVYDTDAFTGILATISSLSGKNYKDSDDTVQAFRIVADHIRCATFMIGDERGIAPGNVGQGYVLRRLLRRAIRYAGKMGVPEGKLSQVAEAVINRYKHVYPELEQNRTKILSEIDGEETRFGKTISTGMKEFEKLVKFLPEKVIPGKSAFRLYDTYGFPVEFTLELARERGFEVDIDGFSAAFEAHQKLSQTASEGTFKGGLADSTEETSRLHTATHLMLSGLKKVLGDDTIMQKGSNITAERLRFDFSFGRPLSKEEISAVEIFVNEAIAAGVDIEMTEMTLEEAKSAGATGVFESKYDQRVKVYTISGYSKEICGGPHAQNTADLVSFKIQKEQSSSAGVRRIKAVLGG